MFIAHNKVRMHDTDMAGILYFANQFRFVHDAFEDLFQSEGYTLHEMLHQQNFVFVIVHVEADYLAPLRVGDELQIHLTVEKIGNSSIVFSYKIYRDRDELVGTAKTIHVALDQKTRKKIPFPEIMKERLFKHLS